MRSVLLFISLFCSISVLYAEPERLNEEKSQEILEWLIGNSSIKYVEGKFIEVTESSNFTLKKRGRWFYSRPDEVDWTYIVKENGRYIKDRDAQSRHKKFLKSFLPLMRDCFTGKVFSDSARFHYRVFVTDSEKYLVVLVPTKGLLHDKYSKITFCFSPRRRIPRWVKLRGHSGKLREIRLEVL